MKTAIDVGYRHIDCAMLYGNEKEIGEAIRAKIADGTVRREDLFVVTKLWNTFHEEEKVVPTCRKSLENFGLSYVDLYLVHWPVAQESYDLNPNCPFVETEVLDYDYVNTWRGMEKCVELGLAKSIGVSNFNSKQIARILANCTVKPVMNQVEVNLHLSNKKLINYCRSLGIEVTSYSPFGSPSRPWKSETDPVISFRDPKLVQIGDKYGKTSAQVMLRYLVQIGTIPIPKSVNRERLIQNGNIFDFELSKSDMDILDSYNRNFRSVSADVYAGKPNYPFDEEF